MKFQRQRVIDIVFSPGSISCIVWRVSGRLCSVAKVATTLGSTIDTTRTGRTAWIILGTVSSVLRMTLLNGLVLIMER